VLIDTDGRPLPKSIRTDTVEVMPGERYGVMLNPTALYKGTVAVGYANMNTNVFENVQHVPVNIHDPVSVKENEKLEAMITMYPNPAVNELFITSASKDILDVELEFINSLGQQVSKNKMRIDLSPSVLNTENIPNGIYQVRIRCRNFLIYKKLFITK